MYGLLLSDSYVKNLFEVTLAGYKGDTKYKCCIFKSSALLTSRFSKSMVIVND